MSRENKDIATIKRELITELADLFPGNEAVSIARMILEHAGYSEYSILKDPAAEPGVESRSEITKIVNELQKNRPIQYILGETQFFDLFFFVNERVLIPRPETEELVNQVLQENHLPKARILDVGTGSGCIAVTLAHYIPQSTVDAIDNKAEVLEVARKNAARNNVRVNFSQQNILELAADQGAPKGAQYTMGSQHANDTVKKKLDAGDARDPGDARYDLIVSNPPYVTHTDKLMMHPRVTANEPESALYVSDEDPLVFYRAIAKFGKHALNENGAVWVEINENFGKETSALFSDHGFGNVRILKDIHGKDRFIKATKDIPGNA